MGNQSEKKIAENKRKVIGYYFYPTLIASAFYLAFNLYSGYLFTFYGFLLVAFIQFVSFFCYRSISHSLELGLNTDSYSIYLDVLAVNVVIEVGSLISDWFLYGYLALPGYGLWKVLGLCWGWATNVQYAEEKGGKQKKKKEKTKYVQH